METEQQWEYQIVCLKNFAGSDLRTFLDGLGAMGWEMCGFAGFDKDTVFKRPKMEEIDHGKS